MAKVSRQRGGPRPVKRKTAKKKAAKPKRRSSSPKKTGPGFLGLSPFSMILYGPPGVGKTSFAANFPKPGFIIDPKEEGIRTLTEFKRVPEPVFVEEVGSFNRTLDFAEDIASGSYDVETAVFDSLTGFEQLVFAHHCEEHFDGDWSAKGFYSYQQGPKNAAKTDVPRMLDALDSIRDAGINVILIAHSQVKSYNNPEGADYDRFSVVCDKETWNQVFRWSKAVLFMNYIVELESAKKTGPRRKAKLEADSRGIATEWSPAFDAKNQYGLEPFIDCGGDSAEAFENFKEAYERAAT